MDAGTSDDLKVNSPEEQAAPRRPPNPPTRVDIDAIRHTSQLTPSEIRTYIDRHRPALYAAGLRSGDVDDYYGLEDFDFDGAAKDLLTAAHAAADAVPDPQILIDDIKRGFQDPQQAQRSLRSVTLELGAGQAADAFLDAGEGISDLPAIIPALLGATALGTVRAVARQKLIEAQAAGACNSPRDFRNGILEALANTDNIMLPKKFDAWIQGAVRDVMTNPWTRENLADHVGMDGLVTIPHKTASALLWGLFDKEMPSAREFHDAATVAWGRATGMDKPDVVRSTPPDWPRLQNMILNMQEAYARSGLTPDQFLAHGIDNPHLLQMLTSPQEQISEQIQRMYLDREWSISGEPINQNLLHGFWLGMAIGAGAPSPDKYIQVPWQWDEHHPFPQYMGGPEDQDVYRVQKIYHDLYHFYLHPIAEIGLDYENMGKEERMEIYLDMLEMSREFDEEHGTLFHEHMMKNEELIRREFLDR